MKKISASPFSSAAMTATFVSALETSSYSLSALICSMPEESTLWTRVQSCFLSFFSGSFSSNGCMSAISSGMEATSLGPFGCCCPIPEYCESELFRDIVITNGPADISFAKTRLTAAILFCASEMHVLRKEISMPSIGIDQAAAAAIIIIIIKNAPKMEPHYVNVKEFEAKYRSKREVYTFLTVDGDAYLPPFQDVTAYFLKDIVSG